MADKYCVNCKRMVGTKKNITSGLICILIGVVLAMFIPVLGWLAGFILVIAGITLLLCSGKKCPICGSKSLTDHGPLEPVVATAGSAQQKEEAPYKVEPKEEPQPTKE